MNFMSMGNTSPGYSNLNPHSKPFAPRGFECLDPTPIESVQMSTHPYSRKTDFGYPISSSSNTSFGSSSGVSSLSNENFSGSNALSGEIGILEHPKDMPDDFGLRSLAKAVEKSTGQLDLPPENRSYVSHQDLGFPPEISDQIESLHENFDSPFTPQAITNPLAGCQKLPSDYFHSWAVGERLPRIERMPTELLFFFFYVATMDALQLMAACELFDRGWRYNKVSQIWIGRFPNCPPTTRTDKYEKGYYQFFNVRKWKREKTYMALHYDQLMERTPPPISMDTLLQPNLTPTSAPTQGMFGRSMNRNLDPMTYPTLQSSSYSGRY